MKAKSKQRFGDVREPYINIDEIVTVEPGHDADTVSVKMSNGEEMLVVGDQAKKLVAYLEAQRLQ